MYPLLFLHGEDGWYPNIPMADNVARPSRRLDDADMDDDGNAGGARIRVKKITERVLN